MPTFLTKEERNTRYEIQMIVAKAVKQGVLTRSGKCSICGSSNRVQFHHADYSKPLEVVELCLKCHKAEHVKLGTYAFCKQQDYIDYLDKVYPNRHGGKREGAGRPSGKNYSKSYLLRLTPELKDAMKILSATEIREAIELAVKNKSLQNIK